MINMKAKKRKIFRSIFASEGRKEEKEIENLLSAQEWFDLFRETCKGLLKLGLPSSSYKITYFIYCAALTLKFAGSLELVSQWLSLFFFACLLLLLLLLLLLFAVDIH